MGTSVSVDDRLGLKSSGAKVRRRQTHFSAVPEQINGAKKAFLSHEDQSIVKSDLGGSLKLTNRIRRQMIRERRNLIHGNRGNLTCPSPKTP